jgi:hypothetical protein
MYILFKSVMKKYKTRPRAVSVQLMKARGDLSEHKRSVENNTFRVFWQIPKCFITAHRTADIFSFSFKKYKSMRSFTRAVDSYKARTTANQIARNMSVNWYFIILHALHGMHNNL